MEEEQQPTVINTMTAEDKEQEYEKFLETMYTSLEKVLEKRPAAPVRKFVSA